MEWQQKVKEYFVKIFSNPFVKTPLIALGIVAAAVIVFFTFLHIFSRHGKGFPVPDFSNIKIEKAYELAKQRKLRLEVTDSVYIMTREPGTVVEQNPSPGTYVKANRRVFITTNAVNPMLVEMPNLVGLTLRQAISTLNLQGFDVGLLAFAPDIAVNNVLEQHYRGNEVDPGTKIPKGSTIDLLLGRGLRNEKSVLPRVIGLSLSEARNLLLEASLNLGRVTFDATVIDNLDSLQARVYSQYPNPNPMGENAINFGAQVDLWLTQNESRIPVEKNIKEPATSTNDAVEIFEEIIE
ncbi:PASTA domain-containing protein [Perlabentimonas gracilis]|uniref:PASTA domain-containing protein n=1 Tax=Perlabentimonas gracilis TaxID=2715279 RepID=UPI00140C1574|nr:PASTA domain-containing protein [Perlabentimonas gracilis]NHB67378.1 PASTA domain-containing protein [Perlabentimonas gracilis]